MTGNRCETTEAHRAQPRRRIVVLLALALLCGGAASWLAAPHGPSARLGADIDLRAARLAATSVLPAREARGADPVRVGGVAGQAPQRPEQMRNAWLHGPIPTAELPERDRTELRSMTAQSWPVDTGDVDAVLVTAWRASARQERASSLRAAFAAVIARRGPPTRAGSRTL